MSVCVNIFRSQVRFQNKKPDTGQMHYLGIFAVDFVSGYWGIKSQERAGASRLMSWSIPLPNAMIISLFSQNRLLSTRGPIHWLYMADISLISLLKEYVKSGESVV